MNAINHRHRGARPYYWLLHEPPFCEAARWVTHVVMLPDRNTGCGLRPCDIDSIADQGPAEWVSCHECRDVVDAHELLMRTPAVPGRRCRVRVTIQM